MIVNNLASVPKGTDTGKYQEITANASISLI